MKVTRIAVIAAVVGLIGCGGSDQETRDLRDGVYEFELTQDYLRENGVSAAQAKAESGVHEITLDSGRFVDRWRTADGTYGSCWGNYVEEATRVTFRWTGGCAGDWAMTYSIDGDLVRWSDFEPLDPNAGSDEQKLTAVFNGVPWKRTGDVPEEE